MSKILQLKINLQKSKPKVWRRVEMRDTATFWDLHIVIRNACDWTGEQPHYFKIIDKNDQEIIIRSYLEEYNENNFPLSWNIGIKKYLLNKENTIYYIYGINDKYQHLITFEKIFYRKLQTAYPKCTAGRGITTELNLGSETLFGKQIRLSQFNPDDVILTEGKRALDEHKIRMFDQLYS